MGIVRKGDNRRAGGVQRSLIMVLAACVVSGCVLDALTHVGASEPEIVPTVRFAVYNADLGFYQDISGGHKDAARLVEGIRAAPDGPMKVACNGVQEIGVMFRYMRKGGHAHDFNYALYRDGDPGLAPDHFIYEILRKSQQLRGTARFKGSPESGVVTFVVLHRKEVIYSTEFDLIGCE